MPAVLTLTHAPREEAPAQEALVALTNFLTLHARRPPQLVVQAGPPYQFLLGDASAARPGRPGLPRGEDGGAYFFGLEKLLEEMWKETAKATRGRRGGGRCAL